MLLGAILVSAQVAASGTQVRRHDTGNQGQLCSGDQWNNEMSLLGKFKMEGTWLSNGLHATISQRRQRGWSKNASCCFFRA